MELYKITQHHRELLAQIETNDGELTPEIETLLHEATYNLNQQLSSAAYMHKTLLDEASVIDAEIKRLSGWKQRLINSAESIKNYIDTAMVANGLTEVKNDNIKLSYRKSTAVEIIDKESIPMSYLVVSYAPDKKAIGDAIKAGEHVLGAELVERQNLQIK